MRDFTRFALCHGQILAGHGSPCDIGRAGTPPAIYAMTVNQGKGPTPQHVSCSAANASTSELHMICLTRKSSATTIRHSSFFLQLPLRPPSPDLAAILFVFRPESLP